MKSQRNCKRLSALSVVVVLAGFGTAACGSEQEATPSESTAPASSDDAPRVVSAQEGAAARNRQPRFGAAAETGATTKLAADSIGGCEAYEPTPEDIAASNAETEALAAELDRFGIAYERSVDDLGFVQIEYDYNDVVAQSVVDSYWTARYPVQPVPQEELDAVIAQNDVIATALDDAGVTYTRTTDESGWESIEYDYDDPAAQAAVDAAWLIISPPEPPSPEVLVEQTKQNDALMAAFDEAGIAYELVADELGWAWVEWDYEDPTVTEQVDAVFAELYPPVAIDPAIDCPASEDVAFEEPAVVDEPVLIEEPALTEEQVVARDADVAALVAGFEAAGVTAETVGDSPWNVVVFDIANEASVGVVAGVLAARI